MSQDPCSHADRTQKQTKMAAFSILILHSTTQRKEGFTVPTDCPGEPRYSWYGKLKRWIARRQLMGFVPDCLTVPGRIQTGLIGQQLSLNRKAAFKDSSGSSARKTPVNTASAYLGS